jgi:hypothetical protein
LRIFSLEKMFAQTKINSSPQGGSILKLKKYAGVV